MAALWVAAACAGWLAGEAAAMSRQRSMLKGDGKENQSKAKRKKTEQEARENEPAHTQEAMVRDYEPAVKKGKPLSGKMNRQWKKRKKRTKGSRGSQLSASKERKTKKSG